MCNQCRKKGHYARVCQIKKNLGVHVAAVTEEDSDEEYSDEDVAFLGSVESTGACPWMTEVRVDNQKSVFKIDTGADVTAIPAKFYTQGQFSKLSRATKTLYGPGGTALKVNGKCTATLSKGNKSTQEEVYVVDGLRTPLLGLTVKREFPNLFSGLGKMEGEYTIVLRPGAKPFSLSTPRRISLPLMPKVREELTRMEQQGVISKVEEPTAWCAPMVVVPKSSGRVRICTDLTELNRSVMRE